ncbi:hypothetical protein EDB55_0948 [Vibrio crassostreae]|uniref:hypothetical protein n=1 Tax=Vibrio crassostreae TaxID=246167 RepID=UPI000F489188|nr:hypothetical protein [Vibrio crassostreae]ROR86261.1 hypothetical protein EDB55_0948 [Vibrio crassostreae]
MIYILVEGSDDKRFVESVLKPILSKHYNNIGVWEYAKKKDLMIENFLKSITSMGADCLFLADADNNCAEKVKASYLAKFRHLQSDKLCVVLREIEAWYLSGIDDNNTHIKLTKKIPDDTSNITKEMFESYFMRLTCTEAKIESLTDFNFALAAKRNSSFNNLISQY